ncbi:fibrinolytic enzyme, isozyme C-like [Mya arenaria]|uniref:fibrinolytic enzyme, isozyme C-like n=1 Tax=Mya arenaria TaxID=6604 RepID=UPI0022E66AFD|nr:fibrinolytic enzyme, isozyme C-like [Mya arenaria]
MIQLLALACMVALAQGNSRIINGQSTNIAAHPHQISLQRYSTSAGVWYHTCGGSLVSEYWVVTAAHCVEGASASSLNVMLNNGYLDDPARRYHGVSQVIMHNNYNKGSGAYPNDIALLKLATPADLTGANQIIELANSNENFDYVTCKLSGWGHTETGTSSNKVIPNQLQETSGVIYNQTQCAAVWTRNYEHNAHICIHNALTGTCQGDSGGPMVCPRAGTNGVLAGVTSWGVSGCGTSFPSVYARVSTYRAWLDNTMANN